VQWEYHGPPVGGFWVHCTRWLQGSYLTDSRLVSPDTRSSLCEGALWGTCTGGENNTPTCRKLLTGVDTGPEAVRLEIIAFNAVGTASDWDITDQRWERPDIVCPAPTPTSPRDPDEPIDPYDRGKPTATPVVEEPTPTAAPEEPTPTPTPRDEASPTATPTPNPEGYSF
jgi:hypothetical protein